MAEFRFDIKPLFPQPIVKVTSNLLPHTFRGDRRQALDATAKISQIIDSLGELSAVSQKLTKPITSAQRLRMADKQIIYLLADVETGHNGIVIGLLKVGTKDLYLFDEVQQTRKIENVPCILDFYIHESRQRAGLGKNLFETMLSEEKWTPVKCSVDRPSDKLLGFLRKHYGLTRTIPQANNFVLYEGFFDQNNTVASQRQQTNGLHITNSPNTQLFGAYNVGDDDRKRRVRQQQDGTNNLGAQMTQISPVGRYGARRPTCSMAEIIHSSSSPNNVAGGTSSASPSAYTAAFEDIVNDFQNLQTTETAEECYEPPEHPLEVEEVAEITLVRADDNNDIDATTELVEINIENKQNVEAVGRAEPDNFLSAKKPTSFQLSKQHTGMKNISFGVGMAVTPTNKMEFNQMAPEDFGVVKINRPVGKLISPPPLDNADAVSTVSSGEGLTDQGYYDLKFFHNKLW